MNRREPWQARRLGALAIVLLCFAGCGPVEYLNQVSGRAATALARAQTAGAERLAPYEYTAAAEYLRKAREEAAHSGYQRAIKYGRRAEELASQGEVLARQRAQPAAPAGGAPAPASGKP